MPFASNIEIYKIFILAY